MTFVLQLLLYQERERLLDKSLEAVSCTEKAKRGKQDVLRVADMSLVQMPAPGKTTSHVPSSKRFPVQEKLVSQVSGSDDAVQRVTMGLGKGGGMVKRFLLRVRCCPKSS